MLAKVDDWAFDPFQLAQVTNGHPLSTLTFHLVKKCGLMPGRYGINETRLARFLCAVEEGYNQDTPYHNAIHAADVVRSLYVLLTRGGVVRRLCSEDNYESTVFAALIAATVHDFEHKGVNVSSGLRPGWGKGSRGVGDGVQSKGVNMIRRVWGFTSGGRLSRVQGSAM